ncbi:MAG: cardiolipin synthase [Phycisphaerales bacterium]|nr:cardiolipin synthase [Phycisphaerales bacterium]
MPTGSTFFTYLALQIATQLVLVVRVIMSRRPVPATLAWLAVLILLPAVGIIVYLLVGENRLGSRRVRRYVELTRGVEQQAVPMWRHEHAVSSRFDERWGYIARFGAVTTGLPPLRGNRLSLINDSEGMLDAIARDIELAESHVHILTYIWMPGGRPAVVVDALLRAAGRGVQCRVLVDAVGSKHFLRSADVERLRGGGVKVVASLPVNPLRMLFSRMDLRNHRKLAVIDGRIAYVGSQNMTDSSFRSTSRRKTGAWIDATLRIDGPAAQALAIVFLRDWALDSGKDPGDLRPFLPEMPIRTGADGSHEGDAVAQIIPSGPGGAGGAPEAIHQALLTTIYSAREELLMTTPYFVPDEATRMALQAASLRGVRVTLIMPSISDSPLVAAASRSHYLDLLESGVRIMHYQKGLLHAKTVTVDRQIALIGSANLDARSFWLNFEVTAFIYDDDFASQVRFMQTDYLTHSTEVELHQWRKRSSFVVFRDSAAQLLGPLL